MFGLLGSGWLWQAAIGLLLGMAVIKLAAYAGWFFLIAAVILWAVVALCWAYTRGLLPHSIERSWWMSKLAQVTDLRGLKQMVRDQPLRRPLKIDIDAGAVAASLKERVVGQDAVCDDVAHAVQQRAQKTERGKPLGVFMLVGPPACGKTWFAKSLAACLPGFTELLVPMSEYGQPHTVSSLFGQAKGYRGSDSYGTLTAALRANPKTVVILDEFEKCDPSVHEKFLSAWNDGVVTEISTGEKVSTVNAIFVLTSNEAADEIDRLARKLKDDRDELSNACNAALSDRFAGAVRSRIDRFFAFTALDDEYYVELAGLGVLREFGEYELGVQTIDNQIIYDIASQGRERDADARDLMRIIERILGPLIIAFKKQHPLAKLAQVTYDQGNIVLRPAA